ncbi:MAG TPA: hypothetical protein VFX72_10485 [Usitatibacteraceae bacterium]|nr:hypothetical protein [Usitatibacteraceae bacterium]
MSKLEKLDLMGVASLGIVTAALLVGWIATTHDIAARHARQAAPAPAPTQSVALTEGGSMKLTVTAERDSGPATTARTASVRSSGGPSLEVALPFAFRP